MILAITAGSHPNQD